MHSTELKTSGWFEIRINTALTWLLPGYRDHGRTVHVPVLQNKEFKFDYASQDRSLDLVPISSQAVHQFFHKIKLQTMYAVQSESLCGINCNICEHWRSNSYQSIHTIRNVQGAALPLCLSPINTPVLRPCKAKNSWYGGSSWTSTQPARQFCFP